jgi:glycosyltransferase involved in cell wall biosynthesis
MDIGLVHPELIYSRGAEKQACKLAYFLDKQGHDVSFYTFEKNPEYVFDPLLKSVEIISLDQTWNRELRLGMDYLRWFSLMKKLSHKIAPHDIINSHNHPAQWISHFTSLPTVWTCNEPYHYNVSSMMRKIYYPHTSLDKKLSSKLKLILSLDSRMEDVIRDRYPNPVETIGSGVDLDRKIKHVENDFMDVIFVGPIFPQKRPLDIVKAFSLLENENINPKLHFVGDILSPELQKQMSDLARSSALEIVFYGSISDDELYRLYDMADISIFVPEAQPWGIFPLETILGGIPTIISDQCGIRDVLPDDYFVVQTGNIKQLASKILEIKEDRKGYLLKTVKLSANISEKYSWENYAKRMVDVFRKVLNEL